MHSKMENSVNRLRVKQKINLNHKQTLWQSCTKILCYKMHSEFSMYFLWERKNSWVHLKTIELSHELNCRWEFWSEHEHLNTLSRNQFPEQNNKQSSFCYKSNAEMSLIKVKTHQTNKHQVYIFWKREIPHNYMLTNLTGERKVQFHQEKQWQTRKTPHWTKCAYQIK